VLDAAPPVDGDHTLHHVHPAGTAKPLSRRAPPRQLPDDVAMIQTADEGGGIGWKALVAIRRVMVYTATSIRALSL
jgi:hypothetical protein